MKSFYFDVTVTGIALVYAETANEARTLLTHMGAMVAGNKLRHAYVEITSEGRETVEPAPPQTRERLTCPCGKLAIRIMMHGREYVRCGDCAEELYGRIGEGRR